MPSDLLVEILQRVTPEQVIGEYVSLRQAGRNFKGLCPFHAEKTPSFNLSPDNGLWHCFGCGAGGNLFQFVMKIENIPFQDARMLLAKKAGIELDPAFEEHSRKQDRLKKLLEKACTFYKQTLLNSHAGEEGLKYLEGRGINKNTIEKFEIGMAPPSGTALLNYLRNYDFTQDEMKDAGLISKSDHPRDYFSRRVIFPIRNSSGSLIGFGGRILTDEPPKYLNSPESPLFKKGENLYALHFAKQAIGKEKHAILCEGYMDTLMLHQHGFEQAVASLGTSFTSQQAKLLSRYTPKIVLSYDGDSAGMEAMRRAMGIVQGASLEMALIALPEGEDPDSFVQREGAESFHTLLQKPLSPVDFVFAVATKKYDLKTPEGKKKIADEVVPILSALRDPLLRDEYIKRVSQELDVSESALRRKLRSTGDREPRFEIKSSFSREQEILRWLLREPALAATVWSALSPNDFHEEETKGVAEALHRLWREGKKNVQELEDLPDQVLLLLSRLSTESPIGGVEAVQALIEAHQNRHLKKRLESLKEEVSRRSKEGKLEPTDEAYKTYLSLLNKMKAGLREDQV